MVCCKLVNKIEEERTQIKGSDILQRRNERDRDEEEERGERTAGRYHRRDGKIDGKGRTEKTESVTEKEEDVRERNRGRGGRQRKRRDRDRDREEDYYSSLSEDEHSTRRMIGVNASAKDPQEKQTCVR